ncbi:MAG: hypothetical protein ACE5HW_00485, partial [Candidatus Methanofastidiosia archaeon]
EEKLKVLESEPREKKELHASDKVYHFEEFKIETLKGKVLFDEGKFCPILKDDKEIGGVFFARGECELVNEISEKIPTGAMIVTSKETWREKKPESEIVEDEGLVQKAKNLLYNLEVSDLKEGGWYIQEITYGKRRRFGPIGLEIGVGRYAPLRLFLSDEKAELKSPTKKCICEDEGVKFSSPTKKIEITPDEIRLKGPTTSIHLTKEFLRIKKPAKKIFLSENELLIKKPAKKILIRNWEEKIKKYRDEIREELEDSLKNFVPDVEEKLKNFKFLFEGKETGKREILIDKPASKFSFGKNGMRVETPTSKIFFDKGKLFIKTPTSSISLSKGNGKFKIEKGIENFIKGLDIRIPEINIELDDFLEDEFDLEED